LSLKSNLLSLREKAFKIKTFSSQREKKRLKIPSEENKHINMPSTSKINTLSQDLLFQQGGERLKILGEKNRHTNLP